MLIAPVPVNEDLRLDELYACEILDSQEEKDFDDLSLLAAQIWGCPIVNISFVDKDRVWLKSKTGIEAGITESPRNSSFCPHTILEKDLLAVEDRLLYARFNDNPNVTAGLKIRFYAGAPVVSKAGYRLGAVYVIDSQPRKISPEQSKALTIISHQISKLLELRVKNRLIRKKAAEQLDLEKSLLSRTLHDHEKELLSVSTELHENITQAIAATKLYREMAEGAGAAKDELVRKNKGFLLELKACKSPFGLDFFHADLSDTHQYQNAFTSMM